MRELEVLEDAVRRAEALVGRFHGTEEKATETGTYDIVTGLDREVESLILEAIRGAFPGDAVISEETSPDEKSGGRTWAVDPIDGTVNMSRGIPLFGIQGVFLEDGVPKASVIDIPADRECFTTSAEGAFLNGSPIRTAEPRPLRECILTTGDFSRRSEDYREMQSRLMTNCRDSVARFRMLGAACMDFAYLACGRTDVHVRFVNHIWDFMPGLYLAERAGAVYDKTLLDETGILILCSCPEVLDQALDRILPGITSACRR